nr:hypothetical protein BaRGS_021424 [Batillaria attramentaria]
MLISAVFKQGPKEEAGKIAELEGIAYKDVQYLRLDYRNILRIEFLWEFKNLTKLQMDNNIIEKIEGLEMLINLVWLDLSFNNIEVIEGLDTLTKLEDLSLFNNHISRLENLDTLVNLEVFSIGNNEIGDLENLLYLRRFPRLKSLNLSNNPVCEIDVYTLYTTAYLPDLVYLDYRLLDDEIRKQAYEKYQMQMDLLAYSDKKILDAKEEDQEKAAIYAYHRAAFVQDMDGSLLYDSMYAEDPEGTTLCEMPNTDVILVPYRSTFNEICHNLFEFGLKAYERRNADVAIFCECLEEAKTESKTGCEKLVEEFLEEKRKKFQEIRQTKDPAEIQSAVCAYNARVTCLWNNLMRHEMVLFEQIEDIIQTFDLNLQDLVNDFNENVRTFMASLREAETIFHEKMQTLASENMLPIMRGDIEDVSEALRLIFTEKDTVMAAVHTSHDVHMLKIDVTEDAMLKGLDRWMTDLLKKIREEEHNRNRHRVVQIAHIIDYSREQLDALEMQEF